MPEFTTEERDWKELWSGLFLEPDIIGAPGLRFLEVGCYEGRTTLWLIENILTDPSSAITVVDIFFRGDYSERFERNLADHIASGKVIVETGRSQDVLRTLDDGFDFIYVDANHDTHDVLIDAVLAFLLLKPEGTMVFDDYIWPGREDARLVKPAVDAFVDCLEPLIRYHALVGGDQYMVIKR